MICGTAKEISIDGRTFPVIGDADITLDLGGWTNEVSMNGDGETFRIIKTPKPGKAESVSIGLDFERGDLEYLQSVANGSSARDFSVTLVDDNVYYGQQIITGDVKGSTKDGKADIEFSGSKLKKQ